MSSTSLSLSRPRPNAAGRGAARGRSRSPPFAPASGSATWSVPAEIPLRKPPRPSSGPFCGGSEPRGCGRTTGRGWPSGALFQSDAWGRVGTQREGVTHGAALELLLERLLEAHVRLVLLHEPLLEGAEGAGALGRAPAAVALAAGASPVGGTAAVAAALAALAALQALARLLSSAAGLVVGRAALSSCKLELLQEGGRVGETRTLDTRAQGRCSGRRAPNLGNTWMTLPTGRTHTRPLLLVLSLQAPALLPSCSAARLLAIVPALCICV